MRILPGPRRRSTPGVMNKLEKEYAFYLEMLKAGGEVVAFYFDALKFRLAGSTFYTPDFLIVCPDHFELHEVKGHWEDDARVKIKVAAAMYPHVLFVAVKHTSQGWEREVFNP